MSSGSRILEFVNSHWESRPQRVQLTQSEDAIASAVLELLNSADDSLFTISTEESLSKDEYDDEQDKNWDPASEEVRSVKIFDYDAADPNLVQFGGQLIEKERVQKAVEYYGSLTGKYNNGMKIRPKLETIRRHFSFVRNNYCLRQLGIIEKKGELMRSYQQNMKIMTDELSTEVKKLIETGSIFHDDTIRFLIASISHKKNLDWNFKASHGWIASFKRANQISSRKITKLVALKNHRNKDELEKKAKEFVASVNQEMINYSPNQVFNADQSGFQLEMHTGRTLAKKGSKKVECTVQNVSSTTHSYTVLPLISADGHLHDKLFVVLQEPKGKFPKKGHYKAANLVVTCHTSHIMTKGLMKTFFEECVFSSTMPKDVLLVVDSWSSWSDDDAINSVTPPSNKVQMMIVPAGCTGLIQPCDVGFFHGFKQVVKRIMGHVQFFRRNFKVHRRDETLMLLSAVWRQMCSPKLHPWVQYAWHASGYDVPRSPFSTPSQLLFPNDVAQECSETGCQEISFIKCIHCDDHFCIDHFLIKSVHIC